jgi:hypothetical protein
MISKLIIRVKLSNMLQMQQLNQIIQPITAINADMLELFPYSHPHITNIIRNT